MAWARAAPRLRVQLVRRRLAHAFEVLPRRWVIEQTFAIRSGLQHKPFPAACPTVTIRPLSSSVPCRGADRSHSGERLGAGMV
jgi:transposase